MCTHSETSANSVPDRWANISLGLLGPDYLSRVHNMVKSRRCGDNPVLLIELWGGKEVHRVVNLYQLCTR